MKSRLLILSALIVVLYILFSSSINIQNPPLNPDVSDTVFVCTGSWSTKYHATDTCRGVLKCTEIIKPVKKKYAVDDGFGACWFCYGGK